MPESRQVIIRDSQTGVMTAINAEDLSIEVIADGAKIPLFTGRRYDDEKIEKFTTGTIMPTPALVCA